MDIREVLNYCHLEDLAGDPVVMDDVRAALEVAAEQMQRLAPRTEQNAARWDLCVKALTLHYYDNRGLTAERQLVEIPLGVRQLMNGLKMECEGCL